MDTLVEVIKSMLSALPGAVVMTLVMLAIFFIFLGWLPDRKFQKKMKDVEAGSLPRDALNRDVVRMCQRPEIRDVLLIKVYWRARNEKREFQELLNDLLEESLREGKGAA